MARAYKPVTPFTTPAKVLIPTLTRVKGTTKKTYPNPSDVNEIIFVSFRTFGGSENMSNGIYTVYDTGTIDTWYTPDITADCRLYICETGEIYDVKGTPENIDGRHQYLHFRVEKVGGTA